MKSDNIFEKVYEATLEQDSLLKYQIVNVGNSCVKYNLNDTVLIRADLVRSVKYAECPEDILVVNNEDLIFGKLI